MDEKHKIRAVMRKTRREHVEALPGVTRALILRCPPAPVAAMIPPGAVVGLYHATQHEAPTGGYARWFKEQGFTIALPWFAARGAAMIFREWADPFADSDLEQGPHGPQPAADAAQLVPEVAFVPLIAFTPDGARLGQGGGHYDRWLADHPDAVPIGLGWDVQCLNDVPVQPHDKRMAAIVTPTRFYRSED